MKTIMQYRGFIPLFFLLIVITGYSVFQNQSTRTSTVNSEWVTRFFKETDCSLPCWEGITPGVTTIHEAAELLASNSLFDLLYGPKLRFEDPTQYEIVWKTKQQKTEGGQARSLGTGDLVWWLNLGFTGEGPTITLEDIVTNFGEPDSLIIEEDRGLCIGKFFYEKEAMVINFQHRCKLKMSVNKNEEVESIWLFPTGISSFPEIKYFQSNILQYLLEWNGYGRYPITKQIKLEYW